MHVHTCMLHIFKNISREPIGCNTKISTDGVEWIASTPCKL